MSAYGWHFPTPTGWRKTPMLATIEGGAIDPHYIGQRFTSTLFEEQGWCEGCGDSVSVYSLDPDHDGSLCLPCFVSMEGVLVHAVLTKAYGGRQAT